MSSLDTEKEIAAKLVEIGKLTHKSIRTEAEETQLGLLKTEVEGLKKFYNEQTEIELNELQKKLG